MFSLKLKIVTILLTAFVLLSFSYNRFVLPVLVEVTQKYAVSTVNREINNVYSDIINNRNLSQSDFTLPYNSEGMQYVNTNTVVVNSLCGEMADVISERLNNIKDRKIKVPIGIFTSSNILSGIGPVLSMGINSMGEATVDYDSSFKACGVNQVNYKLWLDVECEVSVITPVVHKNIVVKRKVMVIDMVYNGGVPRAYMNVNK